MKTSRHTQAQTAHPKATTFLCVFLTLVLAIALTAIPTFSLADEHADATQQGYGAVDKDGTANKQEVIYAKLSHTGALQEAYVVNVFTVEDATKDTTGDAGQDAQDAGQDATTIKDYGAYDAVYNLSTEAPLAQTSDAVTFTQETTTFSYQGNNPQIMLPWNIAFHYYLDGKEVAAEELAEASGDFALTMEITQNPQGDVSFYENYVLQTSVTLPDDCAFDVRSADGSIALSGSDTQVTFMALPDSEGSVSLQAQVENFSLPSIQVAAVPLSLGLSLPTSDEISGQFDELIEATDQLAAGAKELAEGNASFDQGLAQVHTGVNQIADATSQLSSGITSYAAGVAQSAQGMQDLLAGQKQFGDNLQKLAASGTQIEDGLANAQTNIGALVKRLNDLPDAQKEALKQMGLDVDALLASLGSLNTQMGALQQYTQGVSQLSQAYQTEILPGSEQVATGLARLNAEAAKLQHAAAQLAQGSTSLADSFGQVRTGSSELASGSAALSAGSATLATESATIPDKMAEKIDEYLAAYDTSDFTPHSALDARNTGVTLVQFVMATDAVEAPQEEQTVEEEPEMTLIDRFFALFS